MISTLLKANRETYDQLAGEYEERTLSLGEVTEHAVSLFLKQLSGKEILETGCAVGLALQIMEEQGLNVTGIDISSKMVEFAKKRNPQSNIVVGDFLSYQFDRKFDGIFSFAFIHLFPKEVAIKVLERMYELLKPGGILYIGTSKSEKSSELWEEKGDYQNKQKRFRKHWTLDEFEEVLNKTGFKKIELHLIEDPFKKVWMDFIVKK